MEFLEYTIESKYKESNYKIKIFIAEGSDQAQLHTLDVNNFTKDAYKHFLCELEDIKVWLRAKGMRHLLTAAPDAKVAKLVRIFGFYNMIQTIPVLGMNLDVYCMDLEED